MPQGPPGSKKILLISPPLRVGHLSARSMTPPLGLLYLASSVRDMAEVKVLDAAAEGVDTIRPHDARTFVFGLEEQDILRRIDDYGPDIVGISCLFSISFPVAASLFKKIRSKFPGIITIAGGGHVSALPREVMEANPAIDYIVIGEGEQSFRNLMGCIETGRAPEGVDGTAYRSEGRVIVNKKEIFIKKLDALPKPSWDLVPVELYRDNCFVLQYMMPGEGPHGLMQFSRGCPHGCPYCATTRYWGSRHRQRDVSSVLDEMEEMIGRYGFRSLAFVDDNFMTNKNRSIELMNGMIQRGIHVTWFPVGLDIEHLDEETLKLMWKSGCRSLCLSLESGSGTILSQYMQKPHDLAKARGTIEIAQKMGFRFLLNFMVGFPEETRKTLNETFSYIKTLAGGVFLFNMVSPFPGTVLDKECREKGALSADFDYTELSCTRSFVKTGEFSPKELIRYVQRKQLMLLSYLFIKRPLMNLNTSLPLLRSPFVVKEFFRISWNRIVGKV
jgi:anaerobic magnesium-protoporphyrin IX monomethyl ester cyclase